MAAKISADELAKTTFWITMVGTVLYVAAVAIFVLASETEDLDPGAATEAEAK